MSDEKPVSLLKLAFRFALWLFVGYVGASLAIALVAAIGFLFAGPDIILWPVFAVFMVGFLLLPLVLAFIFGRRIRHDHGFSVGQVTQVTVGGMGLIILLVELKTLWELHTGEEQPEPERFPYFVSMILIGWALTAAAGALGAWWEGRTAPGPCAPRRRGAGAGLFNDNDGE